MQYLIETIQYLLMGAGVTLKVYFVTLLFSIPIGVICAIGKLSRFKVLHVIIGAYTWVFRGTPLVLQLIFVYYGLALSTQDTWLHEYFVFTPMQAACITFVINYSAYFTEIFRGGIQSIGKGQYEAAKSLGMTPWVTMKRIILPQATKVIIPPLGNEAITLIKDTALCYVITLPEILKNSYTLLSTQVSIVPLVIAAGIYLFFTFVIIQVFRFIESKLSYY